MSAPNLFLSIKLRPAKVFIVERKTLMPCDLTELEHDARKLTDFVFSAVQGLFGNQAKMSLAKFALFELDRQMSGKSLSLKPAEAARLAGFRFEVPAEVLVKSRVEKCCQDQLVSKLRSVEFDNFSALKADRSANLGAVDKGMVKLEHRRKYKELWMSAKLWDKELLVKFNVPAKYNKLDFVPPRIVVSKEGKISFVFSAKRKTYRPLLSDEFVLRIDRGIAKTFVWAVTSLSDGKVVSSGELSDVCKDKVAKMKALDCEIRSIQKKIAKLNINSSKTRNNKYYKRLVDQLNGKRFKRTRVKKSLAKQAAQELVSIAQIHGNTLIILEDLSWSGNWAGRFPFGLVGKWVEHYAELAGTHVQKVGAAHTSKICSSCGEKGSNFAGRAYKCKACRTEIDRDLNAAINIARRGSDRAAKSAVTRKKTVNTKQAPKITRNKVIRIEICIYAGQESNFRRVCSGLRYLSVATSKTRTGLKKHVFYYRL